MKNVQISVDEELLRAIDAAGKPLGLKRSQIVRRALRIWLHQQSIENFENKWIAALKSSPDDAKRAERWRDAQTWGEQ